MRSALRRTAREQLTLRHLAGIAAFLGVLAVVVDVPRDTLVSVAWAVVLVEVITVFQNTPEVDQRYVKGAIGAFVAVGSLAMAYTVVTGGSGAMWLPAVLLAFGLWLCLDTVADFRRGRGEHAGQSDDISSAEVLLSMSHGHVVADALEDGPRTVEDLADECDLTESRVRDALGRLERSDIVARDGDRYALREENLGPTAFVRNALTWTARRLVRPLRG